MWNPIICIILYSDSLGVATVVLSPYKVGKHINPLSLGNLQARRTHSDSLRVCPRWPTSLSCAAVDSPGLPGSGHKHCQMVRVISAGYVLARHGLDHLRLVHQKIPKCIQSLLKTITLPLTVHARRGVIKEATRGRLL